MWENLVPNICSFLANCANLAKDINAPGLDFHICEIKIIISNSGGFWISDNVCILNTTLWLQETESFRQKKETKRIPGNQKTILKNHQWFYRCGFKPLYYHSIFCTFLFLHGAMLSQDNHSHKVKTKITDSSELIFS